VDRYISVACCSTVNSLHNDDNTIAQCLLSVYYDWKAILVCTLLGKPPVISYDLLLTDKQLNMVSSVSVGFAFFSIIKFCVALRPQIVRHNPLAKIVAFKIIVGLTFFEQVSLLFVFTSQRRPY
jgi:Organic solute transporter Ostalpha